MPQNTHTLTESSGPAKRAQSLGQLAATGMVWLSVQSVGAKIAGVAGQILLAWLLSPADFGLFAIAYSVNAFANIFQQTGQREVLLQRQSHMRLWLTPAFWLAFVFACAVFLTGSLCAPVCAAVYHEPRVFGLIIILASASGIATLSTIPAAVLQAQMRFRSLAIANLVSSVLMPVLSVILAWRGYGAYSFAIPWPITAALRFILLWRAARPSIRMTPQFGRWRYLFGTSIMVLVGRSCGTLMLTLGQFIMGLFHDKEVVGLYYFAFNFSWQAWVLFALNMDGVLFPALSKLRDDPVKQHRSFVTAMSLMASIGIPACLVQAAIAEPSINAVFDPRKWGSTIPLVQALSVGMAFRTIGWPSLSVLQAQGRFRTFMVFSLVSAVVYSVVLWITAATATSEHAPLLLSLASSAFFMVEGIAVLRLALGPQGGGWMDVFRTIAMPLMIGSAATVLAITACHWIPPMRGQAWIQLGWTLGVFSLTYALGLYLLARPQWNEALSRVRGLFVPRGRAQRAV